jgi:enoyl-CoA hydratase
VVPVADLMEDAMKVADTIATMSLPSVLAAKEAVNRAFESGLSEGVLFERRIFHALFATEDQKEGMKAFIEKRKPAWKNR